MTSLFDFAQTNRQWEASLPRTDSYLADTRKSCTLPKPVVPARQTMPKQEAGQRPARALPYVLHANRLSHGALELANEGTQGAVLRIRDGYTARHYTLAAGQRLSVPLEAKAGQPLTVHGPNGFFRAFYGQDLPECRLRYDPAQSSVFLSLLHAGQAPRMLRIEDGYTHARHTVTVPPDAETATSWLLAASDNWYDLAVYDAHDGTLLMQFAGHMENGKPSRTDPHMGR
ncbi:Phospholipase C [Acetobacter malorum]|uniref:Phospholipase C n=1 Tax=Acetobacter malorum TaxID=178901 RepID=A0A177GFP1_9PROT|nr:Phospholipase C [Acetobacter malorum]